MKDETAKRDESKAVENELLKEETVERFPSLTEAECTPEIQADSPTGNTSENWSIEGHDPESCGKDVFGHDRHNETLSKGDKAPVIPARNLGRIRDARSGLALVSARSSSLE